jgi:hypothetical protein
MKKNDNSDEFNVLIGYRKKIIGIYNMGNPMRVNGAKTQPFFE